MVQCFISLSSYSPIFQGRELFSFSMSFHRDLSLNVILTPGKICFVCVRCCKRCSLQLLQNNLIQTLEVHANQSSRYRSIIWLSSCNSGVWNTIIMPWGKWPFVYLLFSCVDRLFSELR